MEKDINMSFHLLIGCEEMDIIRMAILNYSVDNEKLIKSGMAEYSDEERQSQKDYQNAIDEVLQKFEKLYNDNPFAS